jgi:hypothetical protein
MHMKTGLDDRANRVAEVLRSYVGDGRIPGGVRSSQRDTMSGSWQKA